MENNFEIRSGSDLLKSPFALVILLCVMFFIGYLVAKSGIVTGALFIILPFIISYAASVFLNPRIAMITIYIANFIVVGAMRYVSGIPLGLSIDALLILTFLSLFFSNFFKEIPWNKAKSEILFLSAIWFGYTLFELVNPEAVSMAAWFYAMRAVALYMILIIPLIFIIFDTRKDVYLFLKIWAIMSIIGTVKGIVQKFVGLDPFEQIWLNENASTHLLFGKLRVFSFFSDAGQFGAAQGHTGVVFLILALCKEYSKKTRIFYAVTGLLGLYGLMISGTRGAMAVPVMGFALYILLRKNFKVILLGGIMGLSVIIFFKFTYIGQSNYTIARMRTAFNPSEDASYQLRRMNQLKFKAYLASRPFGGGVGSAGFWGLRFSPRTFLAQTATDSWYVKIWAEMGIVGLTLYLLIMVYILLKSMFLIFFKIKDPEISALMSALTSGYLGILVASYGNGIIGQLPTGLLIYSSMAYIYLGPRLELEKKMELESLNENNLALQNKMKQNLKLNT